MHHFGIPVVYRFNHSYDVLCSSLPWTIHKGVTLQKVHRCWRLFCVFIMPRSLQKVESFRILFLNMIETVHFSYRFRTKKWAYFFVTVFTSLSFGPLPHIVLHVVLIGHMQCCNAFQCLKQWQNQHHSRTLGWPFHKVRAKCCSWLISNPVAHLRVASLKSHSEDRLRFSWFSSFCWGRGKIISRVQASKLPLVSTQSPFRQLLWDFYPGVQLL